jgi:hypothetical protein
LNVPSPNDINIVASDEASPGSGKAKLAYRGSDTEDEGPDYRALRRSHLDEKRGGAFFDDLRLGLNFEEATEVGFYGFH